MMFLYFFIALGGVGAADAGATGGLEALARAGHWDQVLQVAVRRGDQLPLRPEEALVAAHAAQLAGDPKAQAHFLALAVDSPDLGAVARVELAGLVLDEDPDRALDLVLDLLGRAPSKQLRLAAVEIAKGAVLAGVDPDRRSAVGRALPALHRSFRRELELALAMSRDPVDRTSLSRLLASSTADLVALTAADVLVETPVELGAVDRWRVAQTFFGHGLYDRAVPILEDLDSVQDRQIPLREVAYLRGRCSFRRGQWSTAALWYKTAISRTSTGERLAELEVHLGRTYELANEMDLAVAAAQRAIHAKTTDDRRLFLARLRLQRGELDLALAGLARLRERSARERGELMLGLYALREGDPGAARRRLARVSHDPWLSPAAVIAAELALAAGEPVEALERLVGAAPGLDGFWAEQAREVMGRLGEDTLREWRRSESAALEDPVERTRRRALVRSLILEFSPERLTGLRAIAAKSVGLEGEPEQPVFAPGLAARLWTIGLPSSAVRWDPAGLPRDTARSTWWTAEQELELGKPWLAISVADAAWRQASSDLPEEGLPVSLQRTLYPLPFESTVCRAAVRHEIPWSLLAGVAREESRWNPLVVSKVGARGLMQLMPATAIAAGAANGRPELSPADLFEPLISLDLGAGELGRLLRVFEGNRAAAVAAYNAGEAQAQLWLEQCGQGCSEARFLAYVSFSVTRGYTEAVLGAAAAYDGLYGAICDHGVNERSE